MARPRRNAGEGSALSSGQAAYVLDRLIRERRISAGEISRYVSEMSLEISQLEQRLARLREAAGPAVAAVAGIAAGIAGAAVARRRRRRGPGRPRATGAGTGAKRGPGRPPGKRGPGRPPASASAPAAAAPAKAGGAKRRRRSSITPEQLASRQLQGRYLALVRQFAASRRPAFAKIAKEKGREAAIKEMQDSLKK